MSDDKIDDEPSGKKEEDDKDEIKQILTSELIDEYSSNSEVKKFIKSKFNRLSSSSASKVIKMLLWCQIPITVQQIVSKYKSFLRYNMGKFDGFKLKPETIKELRKELIVFLSEISEGEVLYDENVHKDFKVKEINDVLCYIINRHTTYQKIRKLICDESGMVHFKYIFNKPDMEISPPQSCETLQRSIIQINGMGIKFDYSVEYIYYCPMCGLKTKKKCYEVQSSKNKIICEGIYNYTSSDGEPKVKICKTQLYPDYELSSTKTAYLFEANYEDENNDNFSMLVFSFENLKPGFYECALLKVPQGKRNELYQILDVNPMNSNKFNIPKLNKNENFLFTLQKTFDEYIKKRTGANIWGLYPIKIALIIQKIFNISNMNKIGNIQLVGDASTGKSMVFKYYSFLLNNHLNLSSNGLSISVPSLRGYRHNINLMGIEQSFITKGYLGLYDTIHIDEAGENRDLIRNLKTFLADENYSYDKAGSMSMIRKRTAQVNISENLDFTHLGQYRGSIKKEYRNFNSKIGDEDKPEWDESWDLHLPLYKYENKYLRTIIKNKREDCKQKKQFWIDGYDYALHERFLFYFYLINEKNNEQLNEVIKENMKKSSIKENYELIKTLRSDDIDDYFNYLKKFSFSEKDTEGFEKVDEILSQYDIHADSRTKIFYYQIVKASRIANERMEITEQDLDLLKYIIENTNCKLDISDTATYKISGPPDIEKQKQIEIEIEDSTKNIDDAFGLPDGEFN